MFSKMREFIRITIVCACAFLLVHDVRSEDVSSEAAVEAELAKTEDQSDRKETKTFIPGKFSYRQDTRLTHNETSRTKFNRQNLNIEGQEKQLMICLAISY